MENKQIAVIAVVALLISVIGLGAVAYSYSDSGAQAVRIRGKISTWYILDEAVTSAKIADDTLKDADFNQSDVKFLNYSAAGTITANKLIVGNGSAVTGHASITEGGLTTIDYLIVMCTSNHTLITSYDVTGANTFDVYLYSTLNASAGLATEATTAESVNWTAIGT